MSLFGRIRTDTVRIFLKLATPCETNVAISESRFQSPISRILVFSPFMLPLVVNIPIQATPTSVVANLSKLL